jgi:hypothetical protein
MPPVASVPNVVRVQLKHTIGDDHDVLDRFYIGYAGSIPTATNLDTFAGSIGAAWVSDLRPEFSSDVTLTEIIVVDLSSDTAAEGTLTEGEAGSRTGGMLPAANAALINFQIARRYRGGKPRIYLPAGTDSDVATPQTWSTEFVGEFSTAWANFIAAVLAAPWGGGGLLSQKNVSYFLGSTVELSGVVPYQRARVVPTPRAVPVVDQITAFSFNPIFGSQRRRNRPK